MWRVAGSSEYLAITGAGIKDIKLAKKAWIWPMQKCIRFGVSPRSYMCKVCAKSADKVSIHFFADFIIGPRVDDDASLILYTKLICPQDESTVLSYKLSKLVQVLFEDETRVLAASMTIEQIVKGMKEFKQEIYEKVQPRLNKFGLLIYTVNVRQYFFDETKPQTLQEEGKKEIRTDVKIFEYEEDAEVAEPRLSWQTKSLGGKWLDPTQASQLAIVESPF